MWSWKSRGRGPAAKPYPEQQMFILAMCRICEPIAFMSIFPYIYYMIASFNITKDDSQIAIYAGMVTSAFAFAEFSTGVLWGRLSDRIGRKPVLLTGLAGTGLSMLIFGFAKSLPHALLARALGGILNGNIGVLQTTVAEMITEKEHQPRAYAVMPFIWCLGSILGPALGGALADPCHNYPALFARGTIFDRFPYLLPNLVCAVVVICGVVIGLLFLEETHEEKKYRRDIGLEAGEWILRKVRFDLPHLWRTNRAANHARDGSLKSSDANFEETRSLMSDDDQPPGYRTTEGSPRPPASRFLAPSSTCAAKGPRRVDSKLTHGGVKAPSVGKAFTKQVILLIIGYGILAYHTIAFEQLMPVFLSTPKASEAPSLPFRFMGGFALSTRTIGFIMACQGVYSMIAQMFLFPGLVRRFGALKLFRSVVTFFPLLYLVVPYMVLLPKPIRMAGIALCLLVKITFHVCAFPSNQIMLTNSSSSMLVLGAINGVAASTASLSRALGPTVSGLIYSAGLEKGYAGLAWWVTGAVCLLGTVVSRWLEDVDGQAAHQQQAVEDLDEADVEPCVRTTVAGEDDDEPLLQGAVCAWEGPPATLGRSHTGQAETET